MKFKYEIVVAIFFILSRLPLLGHDTFNTDVWKWKARSFDFSTGIFTFDFAKTLQKYHPGVTLMWAGTSAIKIANLYLDYNSSLNALDQLFILHTLQKFAVVLILGATVAIIFFALHKIVDLRYAIFATLFFSLEPFYLALSREFHLEGLLSTFMLASMLWFYVHLQSQADRKSLVLSAIFAGLAILTKTSAIYLFLFVGLISLLRMRQGHKLADEGKRCAAFVGIALITIVAIWPSLWIAPAHTVTELVRGVQEIGVDTEHIQFYFGMLVGDPGPTYYPVVLALRSTPLLLLGLVGLIFVHRKLSESQRRFVNYLGLFAIFYILQITIPTKKLDRYVLPAFTVLSLASAIFWVWLSKKIELSRVLFFALFFLYMLVTDIALLPDYLSYFNPLFGGLGTGIKILEPKWLIGQREIVQHFKSVQKVNGYEYSDNNESFEEIIYRAPRKNVLSVGFQEKYYTQIWPFFREIGAWAVIQDLTPFAMQTEYFVYPVWDDRSAQENRFNLKYLADIKLRGVTLYKVYEKIE
jgi:hypothetical protein